MALIVIQVGQCGNQLGFEFFNIIAHDVRNTKDHRTSETELDFRKFVVQSFFKEELPDGSLVARAILIDTEPKVIQQVQHLAKRGGFWCYPNYIYMKRQGSGNNWAHGYHAHGSSSKDQLLNLVKVVVESTENFVGFLIFMSLAGGTGSGQGTYLSEILREEYPRVTIINVVVWPFTLGEVAVQSYNTLLSLWRLRVCSNAIVAIENEHLHKICTRRLSLKEVSQRDMNQVAAQHLATLLLPSGSEEGTKMNIDNLVNHLVPHHHYKLVTLQSAPQEPPASLPYDTATWPSLIKTLQRLVLYQILGKEGLSYNCTKQEIRPSFVSNLLVARGRDTQKVDAQLLSSPFLNYPTWARLVEQPKVWHNQRCFLSYRRCATLATNSNIILPTLDRCVEKAWNMFLAKAYLFQYEQHGLSVDDFLQSFISAEQLIASYKHLNS